MDHVRVLVILIVLIPIDERYYTGPVFPTMIVLQMIIHQHRHYLPFATLHEIQRNGSCPTVSLVKIHQTPVIW